MSRSLAGDEGDVSVRAAGASDELHRSLSASGDTRCFVVYDPAIVAPDKDDAASDWTSDDTDWLRVPVSHPQMDPSRWPLWLAIDVATSHGSRIAQSSITESLRELQASSLRQGSGRRIGGWIALNSDASPRHAAASLARSMLQRPPTGGTLLLRLCDPSVLWALWPLLDPEQRSQLLGPIRAWWLLDPLGGLVKLEADEDAVASGPLALRPSQWADLALIQPLHQALREGLIQGSNDSVALSPRLDGARDVAMHALRRATSYGLSDAADLSAFATHAIAHHPRFDQHPRVQELLRNRLADDEYYTSVIESLTFDDWNNIGAELRDAQAFRKEE